MDIPPETITPQQNPSLPSSEHEETPQLPSKKFAKLKPKLIYIGGVSILTLFLVIGTVYAVYLAPKTSPTQITTPTPAPSPSPDLADSEATNSDTLAASPSPTPATSSPSPVVAKPATPLPVVLAKADVYVYTIHMSSTAPGSASILEGDTYVNPEIPGSYQYYLSAVIKNHGPSEAKDITWTLYNHNQSLTSGTISTLAPGQEERVTHLFGSPLGDHSIKVETKINNAGITDTNTGNNILTQKIRINPETESPQISLSLFKDSANQQTCVDPFVTDNFSSESEITFQAKLDSESYQNITYRPNPSSEARYQRCITGPAGQAHTFWFKATDKRGNIAEKSLEFTLYSF